MHLCSIEINIHYSRNEWLSMTCAGESLCPLRVLSMYAYVYVDVLGLRVSWSCPSGTDVLMCGIRGEVLGLTRFPCRFRVSVKAAVQRNRPKARGVKALMQKHNTNPKHVMQTTETYCVGSEGRTATLPTTTGHAEGFGTFRPVGLFSSFAVASTMRRLRPTRDPSRRCHSNAEGGSPGSGVGPVMLRG